MKKLLATVLLICLIFTAIGLANARVFDFRTHKNRQFINGLSIDNLPHIYCCSLGEYGYSGIFVGDTVKVSGEVKGAEKSVEVKFPSGNVVSIPVSNHYFEKMITFNEEGQYKINDEPFEVDYRAIVLPPTKTAKYILHYERTVNDEYSRTFVNWNDACVAEDGKSSVAYLLIVDKNGNPIPNLKGKKFTTDKYGIAKVHFSFRAINVYGDVKAVKYNKIVFDKNGNVVYSSLKNKPVNAFYENGELYVDVYQFIDYACSDIYLLPKKDIEIGKTYIRYVPSDIAYPAEVVEKDGRVYADIEALLAVINRLPIDIRGVSVRYYTDRIEVYIVSDNVA